MDAPSECLCGSNNFHRVIVRARNAKPFETEFVACVECALMYWAPEPVEPLRELPPMHEPTTDPRNALGSNRRN